MGKTREEINARLDRLAGSGKGWGGGLPLPLLFTAFLNELLDNEVVTRERLTEIAADVLCFKSNQVMSTWRSWEDFTDDVLAQMASKGAAREAGGKWSRGGALIPGSYIEIIPGRTWKGGRKRPRDGATVWNKEERERRSRDAHAEHEATSLVGHFRDAAPDHTSAIRESVGEVGQLYPVLVDQYGRILDGGHRKAVDPDWEEKQVTVRSEEHALLIGLWANQGRSLPEETRTRINKLIGELSGTNQMKRERAKAELVKDASRSNVVIAALVGVSDHFVMTVREKLRSDRGIHAYEFKGGQGKRGGKHSPHCWCQPDAAPSPPAQATRRPPPVLTDEVQAEVDEMVADGASRAEVIKRTGLKENTAHRAFEKAKVRKECQSASAPASAHSHEWGPWVTRRLRQCAECGDREVAED